MSVFLEPVCTLIISVLVAFPKIYQQDYERGKATSEVNAAILVSERPRLLYMNTETTLVATKGKPSAM